MTRDSSFDNPLEQAMQRGTIGGATTKQTEPAPPSGVPDRKTSKRQVVKTSPRRSAAPSASGKKQQTVYLDPEVIRAVKHTAVDEDKDISELVQAAIVEYFERHNIHYRRHREG
jgi:hypothetical protein